MNATQIIKQVLHGTLPDGYCLVVKRPGRYVTRHRYRQVLYGTLPDAALAEPDCPSVVLELMRECCASEPRARPSFADIAAKLEVCTRIHIV